MAGDVVARPTKVLNIAEGRMGMTGSGWSQIDCCGDIPEIPVLPETLLQVELKAQEQVVSLSEISQLVLGDLGATLQIFRRAGCECAADDYKPARIEDCISILGVRGCVDAASSHAISGDTSRDRATEFWAHAKEIAENCIRASEEINSAADSNQAYLVGLFHELGTLPAVLSWEYPIIASNDGREVGLCIAERCSLPACVLDYFDTGRGQGSVHQWSEIVRRAHEMVSSSSIHAPVVTI